MLPQGLYLSTLPGQPYVVSFFCRPPCAWLGIQETETPHVIVPVPPHLGTYLLSQFQTSSIAVGRNKLTFPLVSSHNYHNDRSSP